MWFLEIFFSIISQYGVGHTKHAFAMQKEHFIILYVQSKACALGRQFTDIISHTLMNC